MRTFTCKYLKDIEPFEEEIDTFQPDPRDAEIGAQIDCADNTPARLFLEITPMSDPSRVGVTFLAPDPYFGFEGGPMVRYATVWDADDKFWVRRYTIEEGP